MRLEIADNISNAREISLRYQEARKRLMQPPVRLTPPPPPMRLESSEPYSPPGNIRPGWSFGQYHFAGACINLDYKKVSIRRVIQEVADFFKLTVNDLESQCRTAPVVYARQIAMYLAREMTPKSYPMIGRFLGERDHTTAMHGHQKIRRLIQTDTAVKGDVDEIRKRLV